MAADDVETLRLLCMGDNHGDVDSLERVVDGTEGEEFDIQTAGFIKYRFPVLAKQYAARDGEVLYGTSAASSRLTSSCWPARRLCIESISGGRRTEPPRGGRS